MPRIIFPEDVLSVTRDAERITVEVGESVKYYEINDICKYGKSFMLIVAKDFFLKTLIFKDVTDKVTIEEVSDENIN